MIEESKISWFFKNKINKLIIRTVKGLFKRNIQIVNIRKGYYYYHPINIKNQYAWK